MAASVPESFPRATKDSRELFTEIVSFAESSKTYTDEIATKTTIRGIVKENHVNDMTHYHEQVKGILTTFEWTFKVTVCGSTSAGKSAMINALLGVNVLPSKSGAVTKSMLCLKGIDEEVGYMQDNGNRIYLKNKDDRDKAKEIMEEERKTIEVYWPKSECVPLKDNVIVIDSPGVGHTSDLDDFINKKCQDSDVFVLIVSYEKEIAMDDKEFLLRVKQNWSKPNLFILINKWEETVVDEDDEDAEDQEEVREKNLTSCVAFLADHLEVVDRNRAKDHIFFVSARERLCIRRNIKAGTKPKVGKTLRDGFKVRNSEFVNFEKTLEEQLTRGAVQTKFGQRTAEGKDILKNVCKIMDSISEAATEQKNLTKQDRIKENDELKRVTENLECWNEQCKRTIKTKTEMVVRGKVKKAFDAGMTRAEQTVKDTALDEKFLEDGKKLSAKLSDSVGKDLGNTIETEYTEEVNQFVMDEMKCMTDSFAEILPEAKIWDTTPECTDYNTVGFNIGVTAQKQNAWYEVLRVCATVPAALVAFAAGGDDGYDFGPSTPVYEPPAFSKTFSTVREALTFGTKRDLVAEFRNDYIGTLKKTMEERMKMSVNSEKERARAILNSVREGLEHEGEEAKDQLRTKIEQLDSKMAELDNVKQKIRTYKMSAAALIEKLDAFTKKYDLKPAV